MNCVESDVICDVSYVSVRDGTRIAYVSYRPKVGRHPTVFIYNPYRGCAIPFEDAKPLLDAGYAFVGANWPATGCSEGIVDHWSPNRLVGAYGADIVEWIAQQCWSDGNVGMVGYSYTGASHFWVAAEKPPALKAIIPAALADGYETMCYLGGMLQPSLATWEQYANNYHAVGMNWRMARGDTECAKIRGSDRQVVKNHNFGEMQEHKFKDAWWDSIDLTRLEVLGDIDVPTMIIGAWQDEWGCAGLEGARIFSRMKNLAHKRLLMTNGDHRTTDFWKGYPFLRAEQIRFLDRWVRGIRNGIEDEPDVKVFWEVCAVDGDRKKPIIGWTTFHATWPEPAVQRRPYFLTADGELSTEQTASAPKEGVRSYLYPTGVELTGSDQQFALLPYTYGVLNYRTAPAVEDMTLLGNPEIFLFLSIDSGDDADLAITLKDVGPDSVLFLQTGLHRVSFQEIDEAHTYSEEVLHTFARTEKLEPKKIYEARMSLLSPFAHVIRKGHSLELTIGAPNPIPHHLISSIPAGTVSVNRIHHSETHPSRIMLPILPGAVAQAPEPTNGILFNQPSRTGSKFIAGGLEAVDDLY
ncbi:CocE/NonD family hydrolase [Mesorhizobium sp.]|uniref:CocE/NonD family hydrolase n=1 Tax=Mesorhizobium sp. TaxID=1871066 RepID=UPI000FE64CD7|nr:CocE/NonD family hydrolase [Mesorhizobium sp.]RWK94363.1 MAG: CocE/NonD family hydrolase [Mesorhizobium sp.]TIQ27465.1 MAG: CocE/NonD family hydrolase [Mesorhizobium sp.]